jgi:hypothetical protein
MAFASPGVSIKEVDLTPTINVSDQNVAAVVIPAETGPVDTVTFVTSEKELVETFGKPNDDNYEAWFAASTIIQYGGIAAVVRPTSSNIVLNSSSDAGLSSFNVKSKFDFDNYSGTAFKFAGRSAGSLFNSIKVVAVDHGADQVITYNLTTGKITTIGTATGTAKTTYNEVSGSVTGAGGSDATFNVTASGTAYSVTVADGGTGYDGTSQTVTILGTALGGATPANDLTFTVTVTGGIISNPSSVTGTAKTSYTGVALGSGGATATISKSGTTYTATLTAGGENYTAPTNITVLGSLVGGADGTNNVTIPVTAVVEDPTVAAGDSIVIKNGATTVGTGWVYKIDTTNNKLYLILSDSTKKVPTSSVDYNTYSITDNAGTPVTLIAAGDIAEVKNDYYDNLEYASGLKWRDIAPQPGTSSSVAKKGGKFDEMHILVLDEDGIITGTPNTVLEKYLFVSKAKDASTLDGSLVYFHTTIAERSKYVFPGYSTGIDFISTNKITLEGITNASIGETNSGGKVYSLIQNDFTYLNSIATEITVSDTPVIGFSLSGGTDYDFTNDPDNIASAVTAGYELLRDSETFNDVDFLIPGSISADRAAALIDIVESRRDCMVVISPRRSDVINSDISTIKTENIVDFFSGIASSSFAIFDSGYKYIYDKYNDTYRYVPCAADVAGLCINTTINAETWFSPAGYNRGNLRNATKLAYSPKQSERDRLYTNRINPIVSFPGQGIVLFGDKTSLSSPSAFNRINVRRLFIELEKNIARFSKFQLFEINDEVTRSSFKSAVEPYLRGVQGRRGIYDFLVVCDETNNTADVIDRNEFNAEIYVKPARSINFITITFVATRTGISFGELTQ